MTGPIYRYLSDDHRRLEDALRHATSDSDRIDPDAYLESSDRIEVAMAKGLLEEAGIPFFVLGQIATLVSDVDGFIHKWVRLQVPRDREAEARELMAQLHEPVAPDASDSEA